MAWGGGGGAHRKFDMPDIFLPPPYTNNDRSLSEVYDKYLCGKIYVKATFYVSNKTTKA